MPPPAPLRVTLLITRSTLPVGWEERITEHLGLAWRANLFFLDQGIHLIERPWSGSRFGGERIYCAYGHGQLNGPRPSPDIFPGGLANLGRMIRESDYTLSLPATHWPAQPGQHPQKSIGILLVDDNPFLLVETTRLAAGLAGCNHKPTLFSPFYPGPIFPITAAPYLEALHALGGSITASPPYEQMALEQEVVLQF
ncbi:MAG: hypothetical protein HQM02_00410 [Magnetococcales bacterium]|nr:hypothetical protein [Magnetococcales bacterium]